MERFVNEFSRIFHVTDAANSGKCMIRVLSDDTDVFVILVCWVYREEMKCNLQTEPCDMTMPGHSVGSSMVRTPSTIATWHHIITPKPRTMR